MSAFGGKAGLANKLPKSASTQSEHPRADCWCEKSHFPGRKFLM
jgi:hypothetical protein